MIRQNRFVGISAHCFGATWTAKMQTTTLFRKANAQPCHLFCPMASIEVTVSAAEMMSQRIVTPPRPCSLPIHSTPFSTSDIRKCSVQVCCGADQSQVREGLREIPEELAIGIQLF